MMHLQPWMEGKSQRENKAIKKIFTNLIALKLICKLRQGYNKQRNIQTDPINL
jgi:hypothetical protein